MFQQGACSRQIAAGLAIGKDGVSPGGVFSSLVVVAPEAVHMGSV